MNLCILLGKVISEVEFKFILNGKHKSIAYFELELMNKSIVKVKAYDEMADYVYRKLKTGTTMIVEGEIKSDGSIICKNIHAFSVKHLPFLLTKLP